MAIMQPYEPAPVPATGNELLERYLADELRRIANEFRLIEEELERIEALIP